MGSKIQNIKIENLEINQNISNKIIFNSENQFFFFFKY
jgi:hypothetical protein